MTTTKNGQDVIFSVNLYDEVIFNNFSNINREIITSVPIHHNEYPIAFPVWIVKSASGAILYRKSEVSRKDIRPQLLKFYCASVTMLVHPYRSNKTHCFHRGSIGTKRWHEFCRPIHTDFDFSKYNRCNHYSPAFLYSLLDSHGYHLISIHNW